LADYKRMVSYMYQYENGVKKKNMGYARVEAKGGQCKITIHMQLLGLLDSIFPTYLIHRENNGMELIYLGDSILKSQIMDSKLTAEEANVMGSGYNLSDLGGILLFLNDTVFYATEWDDKPIIAAEVMEAMRPRPKKAERNPTIEAPPIKAPITGNLPTENRKVNTVQDAVQKRNEGEQPAVEVLKKIETEQPEVLTEEPVSKAAKVSDLGLTLEEELLIPKYKLPRGWKTVEAFPKKAALMLDNNTATESYTEKFNSSNRMDSVLDSDTRQEVVSDKDKLQELVLDSETIQEMASDRDNLEEVVSDSDKHSELVLNSDAIREMASDGDNLEEVVSDNDKLQEMAPEVDNFEEVVSDSDKLHELVLNSDEIQEIASEGDNIKETDEFGDKGEFDSYSETDEGNLDAASLDTNSQESMDTMDRTCAEEEEKPDSPIATYFFEHYSRIYPFEDNEITLCVKIEPKDIGLLPKDLWGLSNNSFLMHGYYCYHHLIFAKIKVRTGCYYILGIPGIYHNREKFMARMFGFDSFKSIRKRDLRQGDFGYWYVPVTL
jgi:hypothetical protein